MLALSNHSERWMEETTEPIENCYKSSDSSKFDDHGVSKILTFFVVKTDSFVLSFVVVSLTL